MVVLNLGCGSRTSPLCVNIDWSPYLRLKQSRVGTALALTMLRGERRRRFLALEGTVVVHDLRRPLPAADGSVDAVYHSHVLEHLDRNRVGPFLTEVRRVLRVGGVQRVVVPDLEIRCRRYLAHLEACAEHPEKAPGHDAIIGEIVEQMVRREAVGTANQPPLRRFVENLVFGDARRRGETHQWMYDRVNLAAVLDEAGFRDITLQQHRTSAIPGWEEIALDEGEDGGEYLPGSLYMEARK
jgi:SAM-dependent methyltransferase